MRSRFARAMHWLARNPQNQLYRLTLWQARRALWRCMKACAQVPCLTAEEYEARTLALAVLAEGVRYVAQARLDRCEAFIAEQHSCPWESAP